MNTEQILAIERAYWALNDAIGQMQEGDRKNDLLEILNTVFNHWRLGLSDEQLNIIQGAKL
jgi:hypothetical protein